MGVNGHLLSTHSLFSIIFPYRTGTSTVPSRDALLVDKELTKVTQRAGRIFTTQQIFVPPSADVLAAADFDF
jgi:hypothetical protein